ncbi:hypothetical protein, partial [Herbiconiux sp.]|uniref:hypothetical protein n=1 Tax=Herbiconiux sp. TaxID=1871186 RepID=UPI0025C6BE85
MAAETLEMYLEVSNRHNATHWGVGVLFGSRPYIENHIVDASNLGHPYQPYNMYGCSDYQVIGLLV